MTYPSSILKGSNKWWSRLGYNLEDSKTMSRLSSQFAAISPGMTVERSTEGLVSTMKAFGIEADSVLDGIMSKVNAVGNGFALTNEDIMDALQNSSSAMAVANNSLDETIALITAGTEIVQDASKVGNGLRTISMRIRGMNEETEELDDNLVNIKGDVYDLTGGKVSIMEDEETYKSTYQILKEISEVWDELSDKNQAQLLDKLFGKTRAQIGASIISNFSQAEKAITTMSESAGAADREMDIIKNSLEYKINALKETFTGIWQNIFNREDLGTLIDFGTGIAEVLDGITEKLGLFGSALAAGGIATGVIGLSHAFKEFSAASGTITMVEALSHAFPGITAGFQAFQTSMATTGGVAGALQGTLSGLWAVISAHPFIALAVGITAAVLAFGNLGEKAKKSMDEAFSAYDDSKQKTQEISEQLSEIQEKMDALNLKGGLTLVEANELEDLREANKLMQETYEIAKQEEEIAAKKAAKSAQKSFDTNYTSLSNFLYRGNQFDVDTLKALSEDDEAFINYFDAYGGNANDLVASVAKYMQAQKTNDEEAMDAISDIAFEQLSDLTEYRDNLNSLPYDKLTSNQKALLTNINDVIETVFKVMKPDEWKAMNFDEIYKAAQYAPTVAGLKELAKATEGAGITADYIKEIAPQLAKAFEEEGFTLQELADTINSEVGIFNSEEARKIAMRNFRKGAGSVDEDIVYEAESSVQEAVDALHAQEEAVAEEEESTPLQIHKEVDYELDSEDAETNFEEYFSSLTEEAQKAVLAMQGEGFDFSQYDTSEWDEYLSNYLNGTEEIVDATNDADDAFAKFKEYQSDVSAALSESTSATGLTTESINKLKNAYKDVEGFDPAKLFENTENGIRLNREELERLNGELENNQIRELAESYFNLKDAIAEAKAQGKDTTGLENDLAQTQQLIAQYRGLTSAYNDWLTAKSGGNERQDYQSIGEAYDSMKETMDLGWYDDPALNAYLDLLLSAEQRTGDAREDFAKLKQTIGDTGYSLMDFWQFDENGKLKSTGLRNLLDTINQFDDSIVSVGEDGAYSFNLTGENLQSVADYLGTSTEMVGLFLKALDDVGDVEINTGNEELDAYLNKLLGKETKEVDVEVDDSELEETKSKVENEPLVQKVQTKFEDAVNTVKDKIKSFFGQGETESTTAPTTQETVVHIKQEPDPLQINVEDATVTVSPDQDSYSVTIDNATVVVSPDKQSYGVKIDDAIVAVSPDKNSYSVNIDDQTVTVTPDKDSYSVKINDEQVVVVPNQESYDVVINDQKVNVTPNQDGYDVTINDQTVNVTPNQDAYDVTINNQLVHVTPDQTGYDVDINDQHVHVTPDQDGYDVTINDQTVHVTPNQDSYDVTINGQTVTVTPVNEDGGDSFDVLINGKEGDLTSTLETMQGTLNDNPLEITFVRKADEDSVFSSMDQLFNELNPEQVVVKDIQINADNSDAQTKIGETESDSGSLDGKTATVTITVDDQASSAISSVSSSLSSLDGQTATTTIKNVTINETKNVTSPANGTFSGGGHSFALGSFSGGRNVSISRDQKALVNELGNEGLVRNGRFSIIPGGAQYINLKKGDIIFNHKQVEELEKNGMVTSGGGHGRIAFSHGTINAFPTGNKIYFPDDSGSGSGGGSGSGSGSGTGSGSGSGSGKGSGSGSDSSSKKSTSSSKSDKAIDWIERKLNYFADKVKRIADTITDYVTSSVKKAKLIQQRSAIDKQISANEKGYSAYMKKAKNVSLSSSLKKKVKSGDYSIEDYDETTKKAINKYKEYYDNAQKCVDKVTELKNTQLELFEDLVNIPTEKAEKKIDKLKDKYDSLSSALTTVSSGMSAVNQLMSLNAESIATTKAEYTETKETYSSTSAALKKAKSKLTSKDKKTKKNSDGTYSLKGIKKNSNQYKRLKSYNSALKANNKAKTSYTAAKTTYQQTESVYDLVGDGTTYSYQNSLIDAETENLRAQNDANQTALKESNANLAAATSAKSSADSAVASKAASLAKAKNKTLADRAKKANGGKISTKGLTGNALKKAKEYNKLVDTATTKTQELTLAQNAQAKASNNAAQSQAELAEQIVQAEKDKFDNIKTYYESQSNYLDSIRQKQEAANDLKTAKGLLLSANDYQQLINQNNQSIQNLSEEASKLQEQLNSAVASGAVEEGSEEWKQMKSEIVGCEESVIKLQAQQEEYNNTIAQLPFDKIEKQLSYLDSISNLLSSQQSLKTTRGLVLTAQDYQQSIAQNTAALAQYEAEYNEAMANVARANANAEGVYGGKTAQEWQTEANGYLKSVTDMRKENEELANSIAQLPFDKIERQLDYFEAQSDFNQSLRDLKQARGKDLSELDYQERIAEATRKQSEYEQERLEAYSNYLKALSNPDNVYGGKTAQEWQNEYNNFGKEINDISSDIENIKDELRDDVYWRTFERAHDACVKLQNVLSGINELIDDNSLFDKNGNLTNYGISRVANLVKSFENARSEVNNYSNDIENLNQLYREGYYTEAEYKDKLNELQNSMLESASSMKTYQDSIIDMYKNIAQSELDALNQLIDKRAEALNKKKAYYDYDKTIRKQTDDLQNLQAQLAALEGINNLEANAKRRKLELEISEAQDNLDSTVRDHIFDLSQEALDDLKKTLQETFDDKWNYINSDLKEIATLMGEANTLTSTGMAAINSTLTSLLSYYGINARSTGIDRAFASGTTGVSRKLRGLIGENGSEIATSKYGLIISMNRGDGVIPHDMTENLMQMAQGILPNVSFNASRLSMPTGFGETNVEQYYDSLIHIDGSADAATVEDIKRMTKDLLDKSYQYTSQKINEGYIKAGGRRRI